MVAWPSHYHLQVSLRTTVGLSVPVYVYLIGACVASFALCIGAYFYFYRGISNPSAQKSSFGLPKLSVYEYILHMYRVTKKSLWHQLAYVSREQILILLT